MAVALALLLGAFATVAYESIAVAHPEIPTITTLVRKLPKWARWMFALAISAVSIDHFATEVLL